MKTSTNQCVKLVQTAGWRLDDLVLNTMQRCSAAELQSVLLADQTFINNCSPAPAQHFIFRQSKHCWGYRVYSGNAAVIFAANVQSSTRPSNDISLVQYNYNSTIQHGILYPEYIRKLWINTQQHFAEKSSSFYLYFSSFMYYLQLYPYLCDIFEFDVVSSSCMLYLFIIA